MKRLLILAAFLWGCTAGEKVVRVVDSGAKAIAIVEPVLRASYHQVQLMCLAEYADTNEAARCVERARVRWAPILEALGDYRDAYCAVLPDRCEAIE